MRISFLLISLILNFLYLINQKSYSGINKSAEIMQWKKIDKENFIDTKEFYLSNDSLELKVKSTGYNQLNLKIDCKNLTFKKKYEDKETLFKPILEKSTEYEIASQLCFLTGLEGFFKDRRPKPFAKIIIKRFDENPKKYIINSSKTSLNNNSNNLEINNQKNEKKIMNLIEDNL